MNQEYQSIVKQCSEQGKALMQTLANNGVLESLYLYYRPSEKGKGPGELMLVRDSAPKPEGTHLATGEGLRINIPYEHYFKWVYDRAKRCPVMAH
jgi:hypothetical protein